MIGEQQRIWHRRLKKAKRILCIQPHYDDNDIAAGGTLAALAHGGVELYYLTVTNDLVGVIDPDLSNEQATAKLKQEQLAAASLIGVKDQIWLDYPDSGPYDYYDLRREIIKNIRQYRPDFVFTCDPWLPYEAHQDHNLTGRAVAEASFLFSMLRLKTDPGVDKNYVPFVLQAVVFYFTSAPNFIFDITDYRADKHQALDCYQIQFTKQDLKYLYEMLEQSEKASAEGSPFQFAESFKILRPDQLHINTESWRS